MNRLRSGRRGPRSTFALWLVIGCAAALVACGDANPPQWIHLARGADATAPTAEGEAGETRATQVLARSDWTRASAAGAPVSVWEARQRPIAIGRPEAGRGAYELDAYAFDSDTLNFGAEAGRFTVTAGVVRLALEADEEPRAELTLSVCATHQVRAGERSIVSGRRIGGEGFSVRPGASREVRCDVPPHSALRFATSKESALLLAGLRAEEHVFRVLVDDAPVFEHRETGSLEAVVWHEVTLPAGGGRGMRLRFEVEGPDSFTAFLDPIVGPAEVGTYAARPWARAHDDVVVFLADTFRADQMAAYGSERDLTPNLDRFADSAMTFTDVWSVSTHTLPTHSTLFSGVYPRQNGQVDFWNPLPDEVDTLAETLAARGFRTVAITDGIMVSQTHGMSQGFAWFDERRAGLDATLERARQALAADDGRPLFLFVQTYTTHAPFEVRPSTRAHLGARLDPGASLEAFMARIQSVANTQRIVPDVPGTEEALDGVRTLYEATVVDLDRGFGAFVEACESATILERGWLLLTSDHGEALGEHDRLFHAGVTFEEVLRVPLVVRGPRAPVGRRDVPVSLIDFAPTVADMAGIDALPQWIGRSLLGAREPAARYAFQCRGASNETTLAVVDANGRKLIGFEDTEAHRAGEWWAAFDLSTDPREERDLLGERAPWAAALATGAERALEDYLKPQFESQAATLTPDQRGQIHDMGYAGSSE